MKIDNKTILSLLLDYFEPTYIELLNPYKFEVGLNLSNCCCKCITIDKISQLTAEHIYKVAKQQKFDLYNIDKQFYLYDGKRYNKVPTSIIKFFLESSLKRMFPDKIFDSVFKKRLLVSFTRLTKYD